MIAQYHNGSANGKARSVHLGERLQARSSSGTLSKALSAKAAALYASLAEHLLDGVEKRRIVAAVNDFLDAGVDDELGAGEARRERDVDRRARHVDAVARSLADRVLLGVHAQALLEVRPAPGRSGAARAPARKAVLHAVRGSVVARREYVPVAHDHRRDVAPHAVRTRRHDVGDVHEVFVPAGTRIYDALGHFRVLYQNSVGSARIPVADLWNIC